MGELPKPADRGGELVVDRWLDNGWIDWMSYDDNKLIMLQHAG